MLPGHTLTTSLITTCANEELMRKQRDSTCDVAYLDLEDGVVPSEKDAARARAIAALSDWDYGAKQRWVRINRVDTEEGFADLMELPRGRPDALILAKVRTAAEIHFVDQLLSHREREYGLDSGSIRLAPMIETGPAFEDLPEILTASDRICGLHLGVEDLSVDLGIMRSDDSKELDYVKSRTVLTAHRYHVHAFDVASVLLTDDEALYRESRRAYHFGFDGKAAISPRQLPVIRRAFLPTEDELARAQKVMAAAEEAERVGISVYSVEGRMVDAPFVEQARSLLTHAETLSRVSQ